MCAAKREMGASGHDSIVFRQRMDYPSRPGQISYYPPEPSPELKKQAKKDRIAGIIFYVIGFMVAMLGLVMALSAGDNMEIYELLIPALLVIGLIAAIFYLSTNNVALAKLSRTLPMILMVALILLYIFSIISQIMDFSSIDDEDMMEQAFEDLKGTILSPGFFFITAGLVIARTGGTMLWTSTKIMHDYIPATIIIETPGQAAAGPQSIPQPQPVPQPVPVMAPVPESAPQADPCPSCGQPLSYIEEYDRMYCHSCKAYPDTDETGEPEPPVEPAPAEPALPQCKSCGNNLEFIEKYNRHYCYDCKQYD
ncbi:MAG: hypothetical protein KAS67_04115 [Thermoplasmata archaeon]|nr:hypothetical protein [Thermoplasmata archaeon]